MTFLVSVVIPCFNHEKFVLQSLESAIDQLKLIAGSQILLIDDCSLDSSAGLVESFVRDNPSSVPIRFIKNKKNLGLSRTLNLALTHVHSKYVVLLASDDFLLEGSIQKRIQYLEDNPSLSAVFSDAKLVDMKGQVIADSVLNEAHKMDTRALKRGGSAMLKELILNWGVPGSVLMMKTADFVVENCFDERYTVEDWPFYLSVAKRHKLGFIDESLSAYRLHGANSNSTVHNRKKQIREQINQAFELLVSWRSFESIYLLYRMLRLTSFFVLLKAGLK